VVAAVYADVDQALWWAAEMSVRAQLEFLDNEGEPDRESDGPPVEADRESDGPPARLDPP
jgi:hypothetical protein